ncbi:hypothetical protein Pcinc_041254, partial [Petrolisthes cinctipes]
VASSCRTEQHHHHHQHHHLRSSPHSLPGTPHDHSLQRITHAHSLQERPHTHSLPVTPRSLSLQGTPHAHSLQGTTHAHSLQGTPHAHSLQGTPHAHSLQGTTHAHSLQGTPHAHSLQGTTHAHSLQGSPHAHSLQGTPHAHSLQGTTHAHSLQGTPHAHSLQGTTHAHSLQGTTHAHSLQGTPHAHSLQGTPHAHSLQGTTHAHSLQGSPHAYIPNPLTTNNSNTNCPPTHSKRHTASRSPSTLLVTPWPQSPVLQRSHTHSPSQSHRSLISLPLRATSHHCSLSQPNVDTLLTNHSSSAISGTPVLAHTSRSFSSFSSSLLAHTPCKSSSSSFSYSTPHPSYSYSTPHSSSYSTPHSSSYSTPHSNSYSTPHSSSYSTPHSNSSTPHSPYNTDNSTTTTMNNTDNYSSTTTINNTDNPSCSPINTNTTTTTTDNNKVCRRYSITTTDDFNVSISINNEESPLTSSPTPSSSTRGSLRTSRLSKSSCYLSQLEDEGIQAKKGLAESLGDLCSVRSSDFIVDTQERSLGVNKWPNGGDLENSFLSKSTCYLSQLDEDINTHPSLSGHMSKSTCYLSQTEDNIQVHQILSGTKSKSSCYLSNTDHDEESSLNQVLSVSLGSFGTDEGEGCERSLSRTRVSIPPSARNRDRSARPESFRISSDMATCTRVLLKARSFACGSLRESPKKGGGRRSFMRTSLREDHLSYHREAEVYQHCEMEILQERLISTSSDQTPSNTTTTNTTTTNTTTTTTNTTTTPTTTTVNNPTQLTDHQHVLELRETAKESINISVSGVEKTGLHTTQQVVILNESTTGECRDSVDSWDDDDGSSVYRSGSKLNSVHSLDDIAATSEDHNKDSLTINQHRTRLMISNSHLGHESLYESQKSSKLRAKSFTGMVTPCTLTTQDTPLTSLIPLTPLTQPSESLANTSKQEKNVTQSFRVAEEDEKLLRSVTMSRRAKLLRENGGSRFSSDLGFGARPKSKREVFV